jgi:hypothetical protein
MIPNATVIRAEHYFPYPRMTFFFCHAEHDKTGLKQLVQHDEPPLKRSNWSFSAVHPANKKARPYSELRKVRIRSCAL